MATLYLRNVSEQVKKELARSARKNKRSLNAEALIRLEQRSEARQITRAELIEEIIANRPKLPKGAPSAASLIREDRDAR